MGTSFATSSAAHLPGFVRAVASIHPAHYRLPLFGTRLLTLLCDLSAVANVAKSGGNVFGPGVNPLG